MYAYSVYGLGLYSEFPIPELASKPSVSGAAQADVVIRYGDVRGREAAARARTGVEERPRSDGQVAVAEPAPSNEADEGADESWAERHAETNETLCVFAGVGRYWVCAGHTIDVEPEPGVDARLVRHLLLGPVLAHLLWQRDIFTLHASVVGVRGRYIAFVGASGDGKSTTAAAFAAAGHALVCDDVAALRVEGERLSVLPGFPRLRLYADSVQGLGDDPDQHPLVHGLIDKRSKAIANFVAEPVPLALLCVLGHGDDFVFAPLAPRAALIEVLRHTYYAHQFAPLYGFKAHLEQAARVVERVSAHRLVRPKDLRRLPDLVAFVEARASA